MAGHVAVPPQAGVVISTGGLDDAVERAFEAAVREAARLGDLLDALATGRLWVPVTLGSSGRRALAEGAVRLPTVRYLGRHVRAGVHIGHKAAAGDGGPGPWRSGHRHPACGGACRGPGPAAAAGPGHRAEPGRQRERADLPGRGGAPGRRAHHRGHVPSQRGPGRGASAGRVAGTGPGRDWAAYGRYAQAATAWLAVDRRGESLVISVTLEDPADAAARDAAVEAVQQAVTAAGGPGWPVDVTFPGEGEPDVIDRWVAAHTAPFYQRPAGRAAGDRAAARPAPPAPELQPQRRVATARSAAEGGAHGRRGASCCYHRGSGPGSGSGRGRGRGRVGDGDGVWDGWRRGLAADRDCEPAGVRRATAGGVRRGPGSGRRRWPGRR